MIDLATLVTGISLVVCALALLGREILMQRRTKGFENGPSWLRGIYVGAACLLVWRAVHVLFQIGQPTPTVAADGAVAAAGLAVLFVGEAIYATQRSYPEGILVSIRRLYTIAKGDDRHAVTEVVNRGLTATLEEKGFQVVTAESLIAALPENERRVG